MNELNKLQEVANQLDITNVELAVPKIALVEERLNIDIQKVETGTVQVHKKVILEQVTQEVQVTQEEVQIERVVMNQYVDAAPQVRYEGDTTIISVVKEVLVVEKRLMLVEELHISKKQTTSSATVTETLRKEEIEINRIDASTNNK
ncbi:MAG: YsnF/AvaK domain-containing protein [Janthinobacterium lividum]